MWIRDPEAVEIIRYFDNLKFRRLQGDDRWDILTPKEFQVIRRELEMCRGDFSYAARNYFMIVDKSGEDTPFKLWESQELILEKWYWLREKKPDKAQKLMILKARQLGCSTVIEGLIAWATIFFSNRNAMVVSHNDSHAAYLFKIMLDIYDRLPWWLKPMLASRKQDSGLLFANPDIPKRETRPGNNSIVSVQSAAQISGVGQGMRLNAIHACFAPDTAVRLASGQVKPIVDVVPGDLVVTGGGRPMPVKGVYLSSRWSEPTAEVTLWGLPKNPLVTTLDHRVMTPSGYREAGSLKVGDYVTVPVRKISDSIHEITVIRNHTGGSRESREKFQSQQMYPVTHELGWVCGLYLAEGTIQMNKRLKNEYQPSAVYFAVHQDEEYDVREGIQRAFPEAKLRSYRHKNSKTCVLSLSDSGFARFLYREFGAGDRKSIPSWSWSASKGFCRGIVDGYIYGDGHVNKKERRVSATSIRPAILFQLRDLVASLGFGWSAISFEEAGIRYGRNCQKAWVWSATGSTNDALRSALNLPPSGPRRKNKPDHWAWNSDGSIAIQIAKVGCGFSREFFDLEVDAPEHNFCTIQCCVANSEYADWDHNRFKDIIDGDMMHALADNRNSFAFLESTGKGSGSPAEQMWTGQVELAEEADWLPLFIPWFFEKTRFIAPEQGWHVAQPEADMREKVARDWTRCDNLACGQYFESSFRKMNRVNTTCPECGVGVLLPYLLTDGQQRFMQNQRMNAEKKNLDAIKKLKEELATTAEEAFQLSGVQVFPPDCHQFVAMCVDRNPKVWGNIDNRGQVHYVADIETGRCGVEDCVANHRFDMEHPLQIWEMPLPGAKYSIGVDVSEGLGGKSDYSVIFINRVSPNGRNPDVQVALWRSNTIDPIELASPINWLGRLYNEALVSIEVNKYDSCFNTVRLQFLYPNLFVWKHYDSKNPMSNKLGWVTNIRSKPMLWQTAVRWLKARQWIVRSDIFANEMKRFQKDDYDDTGASAERNFHDDVLISGMMALFCAHDLDYSEDNDFIPVQSQNGTGGTGNSWINTCERCRHEWETDEPSRRCSNCRCMLIKSHSTGMAGPLKQMDFDKELNKTHADVIADMDDRPERSELDAEDSFATF